MRQQTYLVAATLADGRGVLLSETCATCDRDLRACGSVICPVCRLVYCLEVCWGQHVNSDNRCTYDAMVAAIEEAKRRQDHVALLARVILPIDRERKRLI